MEDAARKHRSRESTRSTERSSHELLQRVVADILTRAEARAPKGRRMSQDAGGRRIVLLASGTRSDIQPMIAAVDELRRRGHPVLITNMTDEGRPAAQQPADNVFCRQGSGWLLSFAGRQAWTSDLKGTRYIAVLLASPGRAIHVSELLLAVDGACIGPVHAPQEGTTAQSVAGRDQGIDGRSLSAYRERARELTQDLEEADMMHDIGRAEALRSELSFLQTELLASSRTRHAPSERARKAVYNRIRRSIEQLERDLPELARHLTRSIKTGVHCSYCPEPAESWQTSELVATDQERSLR